MASVEKETTFLLSFVTRATGEVLLYRERIAGSRSNAYTFANLHSHVPLLASLKDLKDLDPMLLADFEEPSEEEVSASSLQAATGLRLGKELKLRRKSKRVGWKVKSSFVQSFHYELAFDVDQDPARVRATIGGDHSFLPLGSVIKSTENPLIRAGLKLIFIPFLFIDPIDRMGADKNIGESKAVLVALSVLKELYQAQLAQQEEQPSVAQLADWPYDLPAKPVRASESAGKKWKQECHMVAKKNHLFYLINVLFHHTLQARPNSVTLPFWLSEVAEAVSGFVSKPEVDQPMLQIAILKVVHATLERQQMALHAQCKNAVHFLVNGMRNREHKSEEEGPPPNVIVLHSCSAALLRVAADLLRTTVSSGGLFDDQALDNVQLVIPEGRPTMSGMEVVRKLFEEVKREKERLGNSFQMPSLQSPGASDYGLDAVHLHFLENTAQNRVSIVSTTDAGLSSWLLHAALHGQPPVVVIGASAVTENGMTVAESGAFALACAARQVSVGVFVMVRTESIGASIEGDVLAERHPTPAIVQGWVGQDQMSEPKSRFLRHATQEVPVLTFASHKLDLLPAEVITAFLTERGPTTWEDVQKIIKMRKECLAKLA